MPANSGVRNGIVRPAKITRPAQNSSVPSRSRGKVSSKTFATSKRGGASSVTNATHRRAN